MYCQTDIRKLFQEIFSGLITYICIIIFLNQEPDFSEDHEEKKKDSKKAKANLLERRSTRTRKCISYRYEIYRNGYNERV